MNCPLCGFDRGMSAYACQSCWRQLSLAEQQRFYKLVRGGILQAAALLAVARPTPPRF